MVAPRNWVEQATDVFLEYLGEQKLEKLLSELKTIPTTNKSVRETLVRLTEELDSRRMA